MAYSYRIIGYRDTNGYCESITSDTQLWDVEELAPKTREPVPFAFCDDDTEIVPHPVFVIEETGADGETFEFDFENHYWDHEEGSRKHLRLKIYLSLIVCYRRAPGRVSKTLWKMYRRAWTRPAAARLAALTVTYTLRTFGYDDGSARVIRARWCYVLCPKPHPNNRVIALDV